MYEEYDQDAAHESALGRSAPSSAPRSAGGRLGFESVPSPKLSNSNFRPGSMPISAPLLNRATDSGSMPSPRLMGSPKIGRKTPQPTQYNPNGYTPVPDDHAVNETPGPGGIKGWLLSHSWNDVAKSLGLQLTLIIIFTAEVILRKFNTTLYMKNYRTALNFILVFACTIAFFVIIAYKKFIAKDLDDSKSINKKLLMWYLAISVFDTVGMYMILLSATYISAPVSTLLAQGVIPVTIVLSMVLYKKRFHIVHYLGCLFLMGGIVLSVVYSGDQDDDTQTSIGWAVVFFAANIPNAISSLLKEVVMSPPHEAEMNSVNAYVALAQCFLSIALSPASFRLQSPDMSLSELPSNTGDAFGCWFTGHDYEVGDKCYGAVWAVWLHIALILALNIFALLVIFYGSAVMFWVAGACVIPLTAIVSSADFMGDLKVSFQWQNIVATILTIVGLIVYRLKPESQAEAPPQEGADTDHDRPPQSPDMTHDGAAWQHGAQPILAVAGDFDDNDH